MPAVMELNQFRYTPYNSKHRGDMFKSQTSNSEAAPVTSSSPQSIAKSSEKEEGLREREDSTILREKNPDPRYPVGHKARQAYTTPSGKRLSPYQWKVYDFLLEVPEGKVTTYKDVAHAVGGSARAAGTALGKNPFSPYIPCHRVITSNLSIGGFCGQKNEKGRLHPLIENKKALLAAEGVHFDANGVLCRRIQLMEGNKLELHTTL